MEVEGYILGAGSGTRLFPVTADTPKPLLRFLGKTFCEHIAERHSQAGISTVGFLVRPDQRAAYEKALGYSYTYLEQEVARGTADAVLKVLKRAKGSIFVQYGDNLFSPEAIRSLLSAHRKSGALASAFVGRVQDPSRYGVVRVTDDGRLVRVEEKPAVPESNLVLVGGFVFEPGFTTHLESVRLSERNELELTDALNSAAKNEVVQVVRVDDWLDLTYPWDVLLVTRALMRSMVTSVEGKVEPGVRISGPLHMGKGSVVRSGSYIEGPVWVGENVTLGPNCYIRPYTSIDDGCHVGNGCELKASVLFREVHVAHLSYVGDSILCHRVNLGAGSVTANLRLDEKNVKMTVNGKRLDTGLKKLGSIIGSDSKIGVNVSVNPGVKIGPRAMVFPGRVVDRDVGEGEVFR
jgi:UDP-N-acetylglucosamine diphosphorylase/glucosamine-1-phosphate N-acetyltransferase